jgi:hypothetical protein
MSFIIHRESYSIIWYGLPVEKWMWRHNMEMSAEEISSVNKYLYLIERFHLTCEIDISVIDIINL